MLDKKEWEVIERLVSKELRKQARRPSDPNPGHRDVQAYKVWQLESLREKIRKVVQSIAQPVESPSRQGAE